MNAREAPARTATASLVYWLLVVCGLAGLTVLRIDTPHEIAPLWLGSISGVALGQLVGWLRLRAWLIAVLIVGVMWCSPVVLALFYEVFDLGTASVAVQTCCLAFLPAAICGYLSLSERGALVAFWFPAMLWMMVILDRPSAGAFDTRAALPLVVGLAALLVAFLRAGETRRAAIWRQHATTRLATALPRTVLRTSPLRAASQHASTALAGAAALVLAAWIAPHLWQKEIARRPHATAAQTPAETAASGAFGEEPCCASDTDDQSRERVREYFPLVHGREVDEAHSAKAQCVVCRDEKRVASVSGFTSNGSYRGSSGTTTGGSAYGDGANAGNGESPYGIGPALATTLGNPSPSMPALPPAPFPEKPTMPANPPATVPNVPAPPPIVTPTPTPAPQPAKPEVVAVAHPTVAAKTTPPATSLKPAVVVLVPKPAAAPVAPRAPWQSALGLVLGALATAVLLRAARRKLVLRHLTRPFWAERLDQRISNHWQRMLIGLRDAGIHPAVDEQPLALARRIGMDGMEKCATILERVRHGVRVDAADLDAMDAAASAVYRSARAKAGLSGRTAGLFRSPL